jgi:hypothetical protein
VRGTLFISIGINPNVTPNLGSHQGTKSAKNRKTTTEKNIDKEVLAYPDPFLNNNI